MPSTLIDGVDVKFQIDERVVNFEEHAVIRYFGLYFSLISEKFYFDRVN